MQGIWGVKHLSVAGKTAKLIVIVTIRSGTQLQNYSRLTQWKIRVNGIFNALVRVKQ